MFKRIQVIKDVHILSKNNLIKRKWLSTLPLLRPHVLDAIMARSSFMLQNREVDLEDYSLVAFQNATERDCRDS